MGGTYVDEELAKFLGNTQYTNSQTFHIMKFLKVYTFSIGIYLNNRRNLLYFISNV